MSNSAVLMEQETKNSNKLINAYTRLDDFLNKFVGKTVMVTVDKYGSINSTRALYNFRWREEEDTYKNKHIIFYSFPTEEYISIPINGIRSLSLIHI